MGRPLTYILQLWLLSIFLSFFLLFFFAYSQRSEIGCLGPTILPHMMHVFSANLECMSEICCTQLADNTGCKIYAKNNHLRTIVQICRAISSQLRHLLAIGKTDLNSNSSSVRPHNMMNFGPLTAEIGWRVWGPQQISTGFSSWLRYCTDVA